MAYVQKPGQGSLFKNQKKIEDTHADYNGSINIDGTEYWLNAWIKKSDKGSYMSLSAKPKQPREEAKKESYDRPAPMRKTSAELDDEIPF